MNAALEVVILPVSDPDKSLDFYRDKLGFTLDVDYSPDARFPRRPADPPGVKHLNTIRRRADRRQPRFGRRVSTWWSTTSRRCATSWSTVVSASAPSGTRTSTAANGRAVSTSASIRSAPTTPASPTSPIPTAIPGSFRNAATGMPDHPSVLVFDVNETLIDIGSLEPHFERMFGDRQVLREWFGQLVMYSMTVTLSDTYVDFFTLGQAVLRMTADVHGVQITDDDLGELANGMRTMPAHPDVARRPCDAAREGLSPCHTDQFTTQPGGSDTVGTRGPGAPLRKAVQRRHVARVQAVARAVYRRRARAGRGTVGSA